MARSVYVAGLGPGVGKGTVAMPERFTELDPAAETVVLCHHGSRSAYATRALDHAGFQRVLNLEGGLDAYSDVDDSVPRY